MHAHIRQLADTELARLHDRLPDLSEHQQAETAAAVHRILRKILHRPTVRAREFSSGPRGQLYLDALQELFDLEVEHKQGGISDEEYEKAKAALDQTLERALKREGQKKA